MGGWHLSHVVPKFERLLDTFRREDGRRWSGIELERATGGVATRSYVTNLRKGRIENPGMDKLAAIAKAMGFPPRALVRGGADRCGRTRSRGNTRRARGQGRAPVRRDQGPKTGETYSNSKIARMSLGDLTEEDVEGLRSGSLADPPLSHLLALARAFGVEPSYLVDGTGEAVLDAEIVEALRDETTRAIARESARLRDREKKLVLGIVRQFEGALSPEGTDRGASTAEGR